MNILMYRRIHIINSNGITACKAGGGSPRPGPLVEFHDGDAGSAELDVFVLITAYAGYSA